MFNINQKINLTNRNNDVFAIGELLIDMISADYESFECDTYHRYFGGSPSNIALNVKKLGIESQISSAVGNDGLGNFLINKLREEGLDTSCVEQVDHPTSMVVVTKSKNTPTPIFYRGADYHLPFSTKLESTVKRSKIVHFSCWSISKLPVRNTIERVIKIARENQILIGFDPNYHPMIWGKGDDGIQYVKSIIGKVDIIKPSEDDAARLFGEDTHERQIKKFIHLGAKLVIMTLGKEGAIVSNGKETVKFDSFATEVVDTTGAGDAFWAGFYAGIVKGYTIREAINFGFAVSSYKLKYTGAVVDLPPLGEFRELYNINQKEA